MFRRRAAWCLLALAAGCGPSVHDCASEGDIQGVETLLRADPSLLNARNRLGKTPLHVAVTSGSTKMVQGLLDRGADVNAADNTGLTPLHVAAWWTATERAAQLLDAGADLEARDHFGDTPLHVAALHGRLAMTRFLVGRGADLGARNREGLTPLELARANRQEKAVRLIERLSASVR